MEGTQAVSGSFAALLSVATEAMPLLLLVTLAHRSLPVGASERAGGRSATACKGAGERRPSQSLKSRPVTSK